jgi:hypothetical protein
VAFPKGAHDDLLDELVHGLIYYFLQGATVPKPLPFGVAGRNHMVSAQAGPYSGKFMRRRRDWKRGSPLEQTQAHSVLRSWYALLPIVGESNCRGQASLCMICLWGVVS